MHRTLIPSASLAALLVLGACGGAAETEEVTSASLAPLTAPVPESEGRRIPIVTSSDEDPGDLRGTLNVFAPSRKVSVSVNGVRLTLVEGGDSQAVQLFHSNHPSSAETAEVDRYACLFCLRRGTNHVVLEFEPDGDEPPHFPFTASFLAPTYDVPLFEVEDLAVKGRIELDFVLVDEMPEGFETVRVLR